MINTLRQSAIVARKVPARILKMTGAPRISLRGKQHRVKIPISFTYKEFTVKTITSQKEYKDVLKLRRDVFQKEFAGKRIVLRSDRDRYDDFADFLVVYDEKKQEMVGCYRLICSKFSEDFYSASEFDIAPLFAKSGVKLELSRACVRKEHRSGRVITLLWRGLAEYLKAVEASYFFGCGSVQTTQLDEIAEAMRYFAASGAVSDELHFKALEKYAAKGLAGYFLPGSEISKSAAIASDSNLIPSLLKAYLNAGAKVCSDPAIDRKFRCTDFLMVLDLTKLSANYRNKFL